MFNICDYNERISTASHVRNNISRFKAIAASQTDPAEKERYAQAALDAERLAPILEAQAQAIARDLGIDAAHYGKIMTPQEYEEYLADGHKSSSTYRHPRYISVRA